MAGIACNLSMPTDPQMDTDYFLNGRYVVFLVENTLFRVPTHAFTSQSKIFETMFSLPQTNEPDVEGACERNPIRLDIRANDFKNFLKLLYPLNSTVSTSLTKEDWISVLKLATMWYFLEVRNDARRMLEILGISSVEKIVLGREVSICQWVAEGYKEMVFVQDISDEEVAVIGLETTIKLYRLREERLRKVTIGNSPSLVILRLSIAVAFEDELKDIRAVESGYTCGA